MRRSGITLLLLAALGCGGGSPPPHVAGASLSGGPDAVLVRLPAEGGIAKAYRWGRDSAIWSSTQPVPALKSLLAFDAEQGSVAYIDTRGVPGRVELRLGTTLAASPTPMTSLASADGWAIYGINPKREMQRLTPSGTWSHPSAFTPRQLLPQTDGSLVLMNDLGTRTVLRRMHPPEARILDTSSVPKAAFVVPTPLGDRIYFATDSGLAGVRVRDLVRTKTISLRGPATDAVPTPSGDRVYVSIAGETEIQVIDRYEERIVQSINVRVVPAALRMDPDGRYLLAQVQSGDSAVVVSVADSRIVRVIRTQWRDDLPLVAPDGRILVLDGDDAVDIDPVSGKERRRYRGGASDYWALIRWNGFRPRAKGLDEPVMFEEDPADTTVAERRDSVTAPPTAIQPSPATVPSVPTRDEREADRTPKVVAWTLSFAALLDEQKARQLAGTIKLEGRAVRVVSGVRDRVTIWRVVAGPFTTREDAERAGRRTGLPFWVYEDTP